MKIANSTAIMWSVAAATLPALAAATYLYGWGVCQQLFITVSAATLCELICLRWQGKPLATAADGSAVVAACILTIALPPYVPWGVAAAAAIFAIGLAKHCYGGLGNNPFNPAMAGYALAFISFPEYFNAWTADATSHPTPLALARLGDPLAATTWQLALPALAAAGGGGVLLLLRLADWRLPLAFCLGAVATSMALALDWQTLIQGGLVFAAFFVITDPVTAATSRGGRWCYAALVGALAIWLRQHGSHSDSIAFAILIGNVLAPLCDLAVKQWRR